MHGSHFQSPEDLLQKFKRPTGNEHPAVSKFLNWEGPQEPLSPQDCDEIYNWVIDNACQHLYAADVSKVLLYIQGKNPSFIPTVDLRPAGTIDKWDSSRQDFMLASVPAGGFGFNVIVSHMTSKLSDYRHFEKLISEGDCRKVTLTAQDSESIDAQDLLRKVALPMRSSTSIKTLRFETLKFSRVIPNFPPNVTQIELCDLVNAGGAARTIRDRIWERCSCLKDQEVTVVCEHPSVESHNEVMQAMTDAVNTRLSTTKGLNGCTFQLVLTGGQAHPTEAAGYNGRLNTLIATGALLKLTILNNPAFFENNIDPSNRAKLTSLTIARTDTTPPTLSPAHPAPPITSEDLQPAHELPLTQDCIGTLGQNRETADAFAKRLVASPGREVVGRSAMELKLALAEKITRKIWDARNQPPLPMRLSAVSENLPNFARPVLYRLGRSHSSPTRWGIDSAIHDLAVNPGIHGGPRVVNAGACRTTCVCDCRRAA